MVIDRLESEPGAVQISTPFIADNGLGSCV
uniref:Uncharacterized protein n=1 Tax=Siphoviridae sp. ctLkp13 TaxID=2826252 RepID=A0A8S5LSL6_9CAUD|nr:MAG TPA: hypothetical protein [Siphoviridae sp. ctLkp13]